MESRPRHGKGGDGLGLAGKRLSQLDQGVSSGHSEQSVDSVVFES